MEELFKDPFLYLNYLCAGLGIYITNKYGPKENDKIDKEYILKFVLWIFCLGSILYLCQKFGDISIEKLGIKH